MYHWKSIITLLVLFFIVTGGQETQKKKIEWLKLKEAIEKNKEEPRKVFVDVYTDWCGWCKKMDKTTFQNPEIVEYINNHYYAVKFDAERKDTFQFRGRTWGFRPKVGRKGTHEAALALLKGRPAYPSYVLLDEEFDFIKVFRGYKRPPQLDAILKFGAENHYQDTSFRAFRETFKSDL